MFQGENIGQKEIHDHGIQIRMHEGEIDIDALLVYRLLAEQFPHLADRRITVVRSTGTVNAIFTVSLSAPRAFASVNYITEDATAVAGADY